MATGNPYTISSRGGKPPKFAGAAELTERCNQYFAYIGGEYHQEQAEKRNKDGSVEMLTVRVWDRPAEPPTITCDKGDTGAQGVAGVNGTNGRTAAVYVSASQPGGMLSGDWWPKPIV